MQSFGMQMSQALSEIIGAIGAPDFPAVAAQAVARAIAFELATVVVHRDDAPPTLLFENLVAADGRQGVENYLNATWRLNPMLAAGRGEGVFRAGDFAMHPPDETDAAGRLVVRAPDEELGFRTLGWPPQMEEVGLHFRACGGVVELGCYRPRRPQPTCRLDDLAALREPVAAAFRRHAELTAAREVTRADALSPREREIVDLLLIGCSSEAIALRLGIGRFTVKDHRKRIFRKLGIGSLAELFALQRNG